MIFFSVALLHQTEMCPLCLSLSPLTRVTVKYFQTAMVCFHVLYHHVLYFILGAGYHTASEEQIQPALGFSDQSRDLGVNVGLGVV